MRAFKCDRCSKYYERPQRWLDVSITTHAPERDDIGIKSFDLCPTCSEAVERFITEVITK